MKKLLYKEFSIGIPKAVWLFALMPAMLIIPHYPYAVPMAYVMLAVFIAFNFSAINRDHIFTAALPVKRSEIVLSKALSLVSLQIVTLAAAIPFALVSLYAVNTTGNLVGMDANVAFFGFTLTEYAVFNIIFLPVYFRTGYKTGLPVFLGLLGYIAISSILEISVAVIPALGVLDSLSPSGLIYRLTAFAAGLILYAAAFFTAVKLAVKTFEKVNL